MFELERTSEYRGWIGALRDRTAKRRIIERLARVQSGNFGDAKWVGDGIRELRIDHGPGYRVYFVRSGPIILLLLCGGDKQSQQRDIARAKQILAAIGGMYDGSDTL